MRNKTWTRWHDVAHAAVMFDIVPDFSQRSMRALSKMLDAKCEAKTVLKKKTGTAQSSPAFYRPNGRFHPTTGRKIADRRI